MGLYRLKVELIDPTLEEFEPIEEFYQFKDSQIRDSVYGRVRELSKLPKLKWSITQLYLKEETCFDNKKYTVDCIRVH